LLVGRVMTQLKSKEMCMKVFQIMVVMVCMMFVFSGCGAKNTADSSGHRSDVLYTCDCGPECKCNSVSTTPGNCSCGKPMKWGHILKVEGNEAIVCQCGEGCSCAGLDPNDPSKCACGQKVKRVNLDGTGVHYCNCGGSCYCNTASDEPGKCKCGMKLKKS